MEVTFTDALRKHWPGVSIRCRVHVPCSASSRTPCRALADELLFGRLTEGGRLTVDIDVETDMTRVCRRLLRCASDIQRCPEERSTKSGLQT